MRQRIADRVADEMALARKEFARRLRAARENADLTQAQVAEKVGVDWASYQRWETGKTSPRPNKLARIAEALGVDVEHLQGPDESTDTALERLATVTEQNARALREIRVALDGILAAIETVGAAVDSLQAAIPPETWDRRAQRASDRIASGIADRKAQADRGARPRSG